MGVTNFDNLPQNIVQTRLREARQVAQERKGSAQRVAGANLLYYRIGDSSVFDWSGRIDTVSQQSSLNGIARFTITLTSQVSQVFLNDLVMEVFTSTDGVHWSQYTTADYIAGTSPNIAYTLSPAFPLGLTPFTSQWVATFGSVLNAYMAFKLQALATEPVTISVTRNV